MGATAPTRLRIAGADLPHDTHYRAATVEVERDATGRRKLSLSGAGRIAPDLDGITWTGAVAVAWVDICDPDAGWTGFSILSTGPKVTLDLDGLGVTWTLDGWEAPTTSTLVTVGGTGYWATIATQPLGGMIQRKSSGAGTLLSAWSKVSVRIEGESAVAPVIPLGTLAVASTLWSGTILVRGLGGTQDPKTGLVRWTIEGEEA